MRRLPALRALALLTAALTAATTTARPGAAAPGPRPAAPDSASDAAFARRLDAAIDSLARTDWFAGSVLVTREGRVLYARAVGQADRERGVANRLDTRYDVASMNKMMTATAVLQQVAAGRIRLGDTVGRHLPDYPNADVRRRVTVAQLLSHTGGLGSYWNARFEARRTELHTVSDYLALFAADPLPFAPGAGWEYSNAGYIVLGAIVERVTGEPFDAYVGRRVFGPAGMTGSGFWALRDTVPNRARSYTTGAPPGRLAPGAFGRPAPPRRSAMDQRPERGSAAGGGYSTVGDLVRFADALRTGRLLPGRWADTLWVARAARPERMGGGAYGYGFGIETAGPLGRVVGHAGGQPGSGGQLDIYLDRGYVVAILTNVDPVGAMRLNARVRALLLELDRPPVGG